MASGTMASFDVDAWQIGRGPNPPSGYNLKGTPFDEYWNDLPSFASSNTLKVHGHSFLGRMAVLKFLMYDMDSALLWESSCGGNREWHWLWGYAAQLDWQHRSSRLAIGDDQKDSDSLSSSSWWNYMNFCFTVCILLGAEKSGVLESRVAVLDKVSEELVSHDPAVQKCIESWERLFRDGYQTFKTSMLLNDGPTNVGKLRFEFQQQVWMSHTDVIRYTMLDTLSPRVTQLLAYLPEPECKFGNGWCRMVEILAACCIPTDLVTLIQDGAGFLPIEIVTDDRFKQWQENGATLSTVESRRFKSVLVTRQLLSASTQSLQWIAGFWRRVVRTNTISRSIPHTLQDLAQGSPMVKLKQTARIVYLFCRPRGGQEWTAFTVFVAAFAALVKTRLS